MAVFRFSEHISELTIAVLHIYRVNHNLKKIPTLTMDMEEEEEEGVFFLAESISICSDSLYQQAHNVKKKNKQKKHR